MEAGEGYAVLIGTAFYLLNGPGSKVRFYAVRFNMCISFRVEGLGYFCVHLKSIR